MEMHLGSSVSAWELPLVEAAAADTWIKYGQYCKLRIGIPTQEAHYSEPIPPIRTSETEQTGMVRQLVLCRSTSANQSI